MKVSVITNDSTVSCHEESEAEDMFGGRVTEVRNLKNLISTVCETELFFISGAYGLVPGDTKIKRYSNVPDTRSEYQTTEERTGFAKAVSEVTRSSDITVIFVPKEMMRIIMREELQGMIISVTNVEFKNEFEKRGFVFLERRGARVGRANARRIREIISSSVL